MNAPSLVICEQLGKPPRHRARLARLTELVRDIVADEGAITLARLCDELGTSRRYARALLEHLDAALVTVRLPGDRRVLSRRVSAGSAAGTGQWR